ncbi:MAG: hypothetical protein AAF533_02060 [Acidobacteriota bacterium]
MSVGRVFSLVFLLALMGCGVANAATYQVFLTDGTVREARSHPAMAFGQVAFINASNRMEVLPADSVDHEATRRAWGWTGPVTVPQHALTQRGSGRRVSVVASGTGIPELDALVADLEALERDPVRMREFQRGFKRGFLGEIRKQDPALARELKRQLEREGW